MQTWQRAGVSRIRALWALGWMWTVPACGVDADANTTFDDADGTRGTDGADSDDAGSASAAPDENSSGGTSGPALFDVGGGATAADDGGEPAITCEEAAAQQVSQGCEFWAVDLPQSWWSEAEGTIAPEQGQYAVAVANPSPSLAANVAFYIGADDVAVDGAAVAPGGVEVFLLPALSIDAMASSDDGLAYRVESDVPVTAYQFNTLEQVSSRYSADASLLLPSHMLRADYVAFTGDALTIDPGWGLNWAGAYVSVVATEDDTVVDIYPTAVPIQPGASANGVELDRGQVLTLLSQSAGGNFASNWTPGEGNLTGSRIAATKPVAVFSGNVTAFEQVALGALFEDYPCCGDHLEEQMLPLETWGRRYLAAPPNNPNGPGDVKATYRVVAGFDGTTFEYSPAAPPNAPLALDAYEVAYFVTDQAFAITGTQPFGVAQFHVGSHATMLGATANGDPSMLLLPAVEQLDDDYVFLVPPTFEANYLTLIRPVGSTTELDDVVLDQAGAPAGMIDDLEYEYLQVTIDEGAHHIANTDPHAIVVYGYADTIGYAYAGGTGLDPINEPPPVPAG